MFPDLVPAEGSARPPPPVRHAATPALFSPSERAERRFWEFFTAHIRNPNTRFASLAAVRRFAEWCERRGLGLDQVEPVVVAAYVEQLTAARSPATVKQHLAALRMLFDWLVVGQVLPFNPASSVNVVPTHHVAQGYVDAYLEAARIGEDRRGPLFRSCEPGRRDALQERGMSRVGAFKMIKRCARKAGLPAEICAHSFRGTGITEYLRNGGDFEVAARIAGHESTRTTQPLQSSPGGDLARRNRADPHLSARDDGRTTQAGRSLEIPARFKAGLHTFTDQVALELRDPGLGRRRTHPEVGAGDPRRRRLQVDPAEGAAGVDCGPEPARAPRARRIAALPAPPRGDRERRPHAEPGL